MFKTIYSYATQSVFNKDGQEIVKKYQVNAKKEVPDTCPLEENDIVVANELNLPLMGSIFEPGNNRFINQDGMVLLTLDEG